MDKYHKNIIIHRKNTAGDFIYVNQISGNIYKLFYINSKEVHPQWFINITDMINSLRFPNNIQPAK